MNYITLTPDVFFDEDGRFSIEYLSQYCQLPTTKKFIFNGYIPGYDHNNLRFNKIVKAKIVETKDVVYQFTDLERAGNFHYYVHGIPNIGKLESADVINMNFIYIFDKEKRYPVFDKYVKVIDEKTVIISGKELKLNNYWTIGPAFYYSKYSKDWKYAKINIDFYKKYVQ